MSNFPLSLSMFNWAKVDAEITRYSTAGSYNAAGEWVRGNDTTIETQFIQKQPLRPEELGMLEDGEFARNYVVSWTQYPVRVWGDDIDSTSNQPDEVTILDADEYTYKVFWRSNRTEIGDWYRVILHQIKDNEG